MEPAGMNTNDPDDAGLDARLRASAPGPLPDAGFTGRVLASLPPAQGVASSTGWRLPGAWIAAAVLAAAVSMIPGIDAAVSAATGTLGSAVSEPGAIAALAVIAVAWALAAGDEVVE
jgi:anti-sigma factor RsiW